MCIFLSLMMICLNSSILLGMNERETMINNDQFINKQGSFVAKTKQGSSVLIEWQCDTSFSQVTIDTMATLWECARQAYLPVEIDFLKQFSEVVGAEGYYKLFEPLFAQGIENVDWSQAEIIMEGMLKNHFVIDLSKIPESIVAQYQNDQMIIVTAKDEQTETLLGFMTFMIGNNYPKGYVKAIAAGVVPSMQGHGLGKIMMGALYKIVSQITCIFLCTRITNKQALRAYESWGFVRTDNPMQDPHHQFNPKHWVFMQYDALHCNTLQ